MPLPIDPFLPNIVEVVRRHRAAVVTAAPGAGKTTRVPPALAADGPAIVLQPRRVAARSLAKRIAVEQNWTIGREVGWHVRFEKQFGPQTKVLFATEGILTARLQQDPLLDDFRTIVVDEFHERSIHADIGLALARQAWRARGDLRLVVMSATLDANVVADYLDGCPVVDVPGAVHPLDVRHMPTAPVAAGVDVCLRESEGQILCFLPGAAEIARASRELAAIASVAEIVELHGSLDAAAQDRALEPTTGRRVILATNIAETSLTVPGVRAVVDTGLQKVARYDPDRAVDSLVTERITQDSADQRAGRAARIGPGTVVRLWSESDRLRPHREPEIHRVDLAGALLDVIAWGGDPRSFEWFEAPSRDRVDAAFDLLHRLGATAADGRLTDRGRRMQRLPLNPRLSAILLAADGAREAALACAILSERQFQIAASSGSRPTTTSDLLDAIGRERDLPAHVRHVADTLQRLTGGTGRSIDERAFRRALVGGYPDRVARRRAPGSPRVLLASGHGAVVGPESGVRDGDFLLALDVTAGKRGEGSEARIRIASAIDREWLAPTDTRVEHEYDSSADMVRAAERDYYDAIVIVERPIAPDPIRSATLLTEAYLAKGLSPDDEQLMRRLRFAHIDVDVKTLAERSAVGCKSVREVSLARGLGADERRRLERAAPAAIDVPSGRAAALDYQEGGSVVAAVKLQELFGLGETPCIGPDRTPVVLSLLAPNGRPVQMTRDLRSFWERTYPEVRKELRARYPKHPWPEDPWTAPPTARTTRRGKTFGADK